MSRTKWFGFAVALMTMLVTWACAGDAQRWMADAMVDAGESLVDSGRVLEGDSGIGRAEVFEGNCVESVQTTRIRYADGRTYESTATTWAAEISHPSISRTDGANVEVISCDREYFPPTSGLTCPDGATCETTGTPTPVGLPCNQFVPSFDNGRAHAHCGSRTRTVFRNAAGEITSETDSGTRYRSVRFIVR